MIQLFLTCQSLKIILSLVKAALTIQSGFNNHHNTKADCKTHSYISQVMSTHDNSVKAHSTSECKTNPE